MSESKERRGGRNAYIRGRKAKGSHTKSSKNDAKKDCILDLVKQLYKGENKISLEEKQFNLADYVVSILSFSCIFFKKKYILI